MLDPNPQNRGDYRQPNQDADSPMGVLHHRVILERRNPVPETRRPIGTPVAGTRDPHRAPHRYLDQRADQRCREQNDQHAVGPDLSALFFPVGPRFHRSWRVKLDRQTRRPGNLSGSSSIRDNRGAYASCNGLTAIKTADTTMRWSYTRKGQQVTREI